MSAVTRLDWRDTKESYRTLIKTLLSQLLAGSAIIDQKKQEIKLVVSSLAGILRSIDLQEQFSCVIDSLGITWDVYVFRGTVNFLACLPGRHPDHTKGGRWIFRSSEPDAIALEDVALVRAGLHVLLFGLIETFPDVELAIEPLLAAAHNAEVVTPVPIGSRDEAERKRIARAALAKLTQEERIALNLPSSGKNI